MHWVYQGQRSSPELWESATRWRSSLTCLVVARALLVGVATQSAQTAVVDPLILQVNHEHREVKKFSPHNCTRLIQSIDG